MATTAMTTPTRSFTAHFAHRQDLSPLSMAFGTLFFISYDHLHSFPQISGSGKAALILFFFSHVASLPLARPLSWKPSESDGHHSFLIPHNATYGF